MIEKIRSDPCTVTGSLPQTVTLGPGRDKCRLKSSLVVLVGLQGEPRGVWW